MTDVKLPDPWEGGIDLPSKGILMASLRNHGFPEQEIREAMDAYATAAVMAERERCARVCDKLARTSRNEVGTWVAESLAENIRQPPAEDGEA